MANEIEQPPFVWHHGNPTVAVGFSSVTGRRIAIRQRGQPESLWISHGLACGVDAVSVDVWNGQFVGPAEGWAVLPGGTYDVLDGQTCIGGFDVRFLTLFDDTALTPQAGWKIAPAQGDDDFTAFFWGAMHGELSATFVGDVEARNRWGLIARHYSAFHHVRVECARRDNERVIRLLRVANEPPDMESAVVVAEQVLPPDVKPPYTITWSFNGDRHAVSVNDHALIDARDGYMGGVEIVGVFTESASVRCRRAGLVSTQSTPRHLIRRSQYIAGIRPGNVDRLLLSLGQDRWSENVCWESGIQYGHIGGSEIKFTQGASLQLVEDGVVASAITWHGPMPRFVDQSEDVRGHASGTAHFYDDHFVITDDVLAWTNRSVGPDIDLLARHMVGPARVALAGDEVFREWALPSDGAMSFLKQTATVGIFPVAAAFPLKLDEQSWWLKALILLRHPSGYAPNSAFAWQCPRQLTASHDFRCSPTVPGREYGFTIAVAWQQGDWPEVQRDLLEWRRSWIEPMRVEALHGELVQYASPTGRDEPREAMGFCGCFDLSSGRYMARARDGSVSLRLNPSGVARVRPAFAIRGLPAGSRVQSLRLNDRSLESVMDYQLQSARSGEIWARLSCTVREASTLSFNFDA